MTDKEGSQPAVVLTAEEHAGLEHVASGEPPYNQRAQALLALAGGADLAAAAITADLTVNQVRYWLGRFRPRRLAIFPDDLLDEQKIEAVVDEEPPLLAAPEKAPMLKAPEVAGELPETIPDAVKVGGAAVAVAGGTAAVKSKKKKNKKEKAAKKVKKSKKKKKDKKAKKVKKSKKGKKSKKEKKATKNKKSKKKK